MALVENMRQGLVMMYTTSSPSTVFQMLKSLLDFPMSPRMLVDSQIVTAVKLFKQVYSWFLASNELLVIAAEVQL